MHCLNRHDTTHSMLLLKGRARSPDGLSLPWKFYSQMPFDDTPSTSFSHGSSAIPGSLARAETAR